VVEPSGSGGAGWLIMLIGRPGSGKSYLGRRLADRLGATLLQSDALRRLMFRPPRYTPAEHAAVYSEAHRRLERHLRRGERVVFDATNLNEAKRRRVYRLADQAGAHLLPVLTYAPPEVLRARFEARAAGADPDDLSDADWSVMTKMGPAQPIGRPHLVVNTSVDLNQAIGLIATRCAEQNNQ
jgi:predicted kinase